MTTIINASSTNGLVQTADGSGVLALQGNGTTGVVIDSNGNTVVGSTTPNASQGNFQTYSTNAGAPATSGSTDAAQAIALRVSSVQTAKGAYSSGAGWMQQRLSSNFATNFDYHINPNGGKVTVGGYSATPNGVFNVYSGVSYSIPATFAGATGNASWTTGQAPQSVTLSIYATNTLFCAGVYTSSDKRAKENIEPLSSRSSLEFVNRTTPVEFDWKVEGVHDTGYIAQDLMKLGYGHLVSAVVDATMKEETDEDGNVSPEGSRFIVKYDSIVPILASAIKEQQAIIEQLKADVATLKGQA